jgi:CRISPR-associated protein Cmr2
MDGDDMGQWVSGVKTPPLKDVLADKAWNYFAHGKDGLGGWKPDKAGGLEAERVQRPLGPGYHAALSEALSNFGLYCAGQIVNAFGGQLIYAGGDDVVALLPAQNALDCANALQLAFRGQLPEDAPASVKRVLRWTPENTAGLFEFPAPGFIVCRQGAGEREQLRPNWPLMVPGPRATASTGIAIGHVHAPMQDTIQAARDAEASAKRIKDKGAFCLRILKRSGESAEFAARWQILDKPQTMVADVWADLEANNDRLTGHFPYRYLQLLRPLLTASGKLADEGWEPGWTRTLIESVEAELRHVHYQQNESSETRDVKQRRAAEQAARWVRALIGDPNAADEPGFQPALTPRGFVHFWMAWAFVKRTSEPNQQS